MKRQQLRHMEHCLPTHLNAERLYFSLFTKHAIYSVEWRLVEVDFNLISTHDECVCLPFRTSIAANWLTSTTTPFLVGSSLISMGKKVAELCFSVRYVGLKLFVSNRTWYAANYSVVIINNDVKDAHLWQVNWF